MRLTDLIHDLPITTKPSAADPAHRATTTPRPLVDLAGLTDDSRAVRPGYLFIARPGSADAPNDALRYLPHAISAGAAAVLLPDLDRSALADLDLPGPLAVAAVNPGVAIDQVLCGELAERFYDRPSRKLTLLGVTGTNGKTTVVTLARHLLQTAGHRTGLIGTVELDTHSPAGPTAATLTTPGAIQLTQLLAEMIDHGCTACVMEVSSHALHQGRADALRFAAAGFTNLTQDHLDYHGSMDAYADAKAILFERLDNQATAVFNADDPWSARMARDCSAQQFTTTIQADTPADASAVPIALAAADSRATFSGPWGKFTATLPTPGKHNLSNALQAAVLVHAATLAGDQPITADQLEQGLETVQPVPGRLEPVGPDWPKTAPTPHQHQDHDAKLPTVLVDYAHTPDALENVGNALRQLTPGRLITVFGCGGDRDRAKRPLMAQAAQRYADLVVLTADNPRTEDPQQILDDAAAGLADSDPARVARIVPDRADAIRFAIQQAKPGDTVLIAGKGHENYQILGRTKHHFDDREQAAAALRDKPAAS